MEEKIILKYVVDRGDLQSAARDLGLNVKATDELRAASEKLSDSVKKTGDQARDASGKFVKGAGEMEGKFASLEKGLGNIQDMILGAFAVDQLISFGGKVINITSEFQKLGAVLTNALGSSSSAGAAMVMIQDVASKTPFSVAELTDSFVKLVNQGFQPTRAEIVSMGDLAASTGKNFDQLAEAIIDAQTGEFERLKEFGIRASKSGDQVSFTFKGVTKQVKFTSESIQEYLVSLGQVEGVSGSMAAISETLGGKVSNLGDSFDQLFFTIGTGGNGMLSGGIELLNEVVQGWTEFLKTDTQKAQDEFSKYFGAITEGVNKTKSIDELRDRLKGLAEDAETLKKHQEIAAKGFDAAAQAGGTLDLVLGALTNNQVGNSKTVDDLQANYEVYNMKLKANAEAVKAVEERIKALTKAQTENVPKEGILAKLHKELKEVNEAREKDTSPAEIRAHNIRIKQIQDEIKKLEELGVEKRKATEPLDRLAMQNDTFEKLKESQEKADEEDKKRRAKLKEDLAKDGADRIELLKDENGKAYEANNDHYQRLQDAWKEFQAKKLELAVGTGEALAGLADQLFANEIQNNQKKLNDLEQGHDKELALAGDNSERRAAIDRDYADKKKALEKEIAEAQRRRAILNKAITLSEIAMNTAQAVTAVLKTGGGTSYADFGISAGILTALVIAQGLAQAATVIAQPLPKYAKGTEYLKGAGTTTSDSILARLSVGERVVSADTNSEYFSTLSAIHNRKIPARVLNSAIDRYLKFGAFEPASIDFAGGSAASFDDSRILAQLEKLPSKITVNQLQLDERGFRVFQRRQNSTVEKIHLQNSFK